MAQSDFPFYRMKLTQEKRDGPRCIPMYKCYSDILTMWTYNNVILYKLRYRVGTKKTVPTGTLFQSIVWAETII